MVSIGLKFEGIFDTFCVVLENTITIHEYNSLFDVDLVGF